MTRSDTPGRPPTSGRAVHVGFAAVVLAVSVAYLLTGGAARHVVSLVATVIPAAAVLVVLVVRRPPRPQPWWCAGAALLLLSVDSATWLVQVGVGGADRASGALAAVCVPLGYLGLLAAAVLVVMPTARVDNGRVVDASIMGIGLAGLLWSLVLFPALDGRGAGAGERGSVLLVVLLLSGTLGAMVRTWADAPASRATVSYFLLASGLTLLGNVARVVAVDPATGATAPWVGLGWVVAYVATGAAAVHPAAAALTAPESRPARRLGPGALTYLGLALALNPVIAAVRGFAGGEADLMQLSLGSLLLVPLVLVRVSQLARLHASAEQELVYQATHDELTGLPNRRAADRRVAETVEAVRGGSAPGGLVCFLDLDGFKDINDRHGHHVGDRLLVRVAERLRSAVREDDFVARFGGDEFVVVLVGDPDGLEAEATRRLDTALAREFDLGGLTTAARASVGTVVLRPGTRTTAEKVLSAADTRMYATKRRRHDAARPTSGAAIPRPART